MLRKADIVEALKRLVREGKTTQQEIGSVIGKPQPRIAELFAGKRDLSADEAVDLVDAFGLMGPRVDLPNEDDFEAMVREVQAEIPANLPFGEWPEAVASSLRERLVLRSKYPPNIGSRGRWAAPELDEGDQPSGSTKGSATK